MKKTNGNFKELKEESGFYREKSDDEITLKGESGFYREKSDDEITLKGEESGFEREKSDDEITLKGEESEFEGEKSSDEETLVEENNLINSISSGSIYFDAKQESKTFDNDVQQEIKDNILKLKEKVEEKNADDILLNDELWALINEIGKIYMEAINYDAEHKKMSVPKRFLMDKITSEKLPQYYQEEMTKILKDINKSPREKFLDTLKVLGMLCGAKSRFLKEIEQEINKVEIKNKRTKKSIQNELERKGIKNTNIIKEIDGLKNNIKNTTTDGGYYYVFLRGIDKLDKDIAYDSYQSKNVVMFDLSNPVKQKGSQYYFYDTPIDGGLLCKGRNLTTKLIEVLDERKTTVNRHMNLLFGGYSSALDSSNIVKQIENLNEDGDYYIVKKRVDEDVPGKNPIFEDGDFKIYDLSNPLDFKNGKFYYGDYELDSNRLIAVKQDKNFEKMVNKVDKMENLIREKQSILEDAKKDIVNNMGEIKDIQKVEILVKEIVSEIEILKENLNKMKNAIYEYSEEKENLRKNSEDIQNESKISKLSKSTSEKSNKIFQNQQKETKNISELLSKKIDSLLKYKKEATKKLQQNKLKVKDEKQHNEKMKVTRAKGFRKIAEKSLLYVLGINSKEGVLKGTQNYVVDLANLPYSTDENIEKIKKNTENLEREIKPVNKNINENKNNKNNDLSFDK